MAARGRPAPPTRGESVDPAADPTSWRGRVVDRSLAKARERSLERAQMFVAATIAVMESDGSINFTVQEVCERAGQSLRTFYQHFDGKEDLVLAVYEELFAALVERIEKEVIKRDTPLDRLATAIAAAVTEGVQAKDHRRARDQALAHFRLDLAGQHSGSVAAVQAPYVALVANLVDQAIAAGDLPAQNAQHAAYVISALKSTFMHTALLGNDIGVEAPTIDELVRFCIRGLGGDVTALTHDGSDVSGR